MSSIRDSVGFGLLADYVQAEGQTRAQLLVMLKAAIQQLQTEWPADDAGRDKISLLYAMAVNEYRTYP